MTYVIESSILEVFDRFMKREILNKTLAPTVMFVGCNPSTKNRDPLVPFDDTRSGLRLEGWIYWLGLNHYLVINVSNKVTRGNKPISKRDICYDTLSRRTQGNYLLIALGKNASKALTQIGRDHFTLPHPSPKNRKLNDKKFVTDKLIECREWLRTPKFK